MSDNTYTCAICKGVFEKEISDEEAMQETQQYFPGTKQEACGVVCDDCWQLIRPDRQANFFEHYLTAWSTGFKSNTTYALSPYSDLLAQQDEVQRAIFRSVLEG